MKQLTFAILLLSVNSFAQNFTYYSNTSNEEVIYDVIEINDGYICSGFSGSNGYLLKLNINGLPSNQELLDDTLGNSFGNHIIQIASEYIAFGSAQVNNSDTANLISIRFQANLNIDHIMLYQLDSSKSVTPLNSVLRDSIITIIGSQTQINGDWDIFIYEMNLYGDSTNSKVLNFGNLELGTDLLHYQNGYKAFTNFIPNPTGRTNNIVTIDSNLNLIKYTSIDTLPIETPVGMTNSSTFNYLMTAKWITDSTYILSARSKASEYLSQGIEQKTGIGVLIMNAENDSILSATILGKSDTAEYEAQKGIDFIDTSAIYVGGSSNTYGTSLYGTWGSWYCLAKLNSKGTIIWQKWYGGDAYYHLWKVLATSDGGCLMAGTRYDTLNTVQERDIYIIKVGPDGEITDIEEPDKLSEDAYSIFPNPTDGQFTIRGNYTTPALFTAYDIAGKVIYTKALETNYENIDIGSPVSGTYLYKLTNADNKSASGKFVVK